MENQGNNSSSQSRFLIAAVLSMAILFGWQYFFAPKPAPKDDTNSNTALASNANTAAPAPAAPAAAPQTTEVASMPGTRAPQRSITIDSPLYNVALDSKGGLATSWIIKRN